MLHKFKILIPSILTFSRVILVYLMLVFSRQLLDSVWGFFGFILCVIYAGISDFLDGWLARRWNVQSEFGNFLDPLVDKIFILPLFFLIVSEGEVLNYPILFWALVFREGLMTFIRLWKVISRQPLKTSDSGKWKTALQFTVLILVWFLTYLSHSSWMKFVPNWVHFILIIILNCGALIMLILAFYSALMYILAILRPKLNSK